MYLEPVFLFLKLYFLLSMSIQGFVYTKALKVSNIKVWVCARGQRSSQSKSFLLNRLQAVMFQVKIINPVKLYTEMFVHINYLSLFDTDTYNRHGDSIRS